MATTQQQPAAKEGQGKTDLIFPAHLNELINQDVGHPFVLITNNFDNTAIGLPVPESISLGDGANYEGLNRAQFRTLEGFKEGGADAISEEDKLAFGLRFSKNSGVGPLEDLAAETLFKERTALNPMTEMAFSGMNMRTLGLSFELVPRNEQEAITIHDINHKLRSLMYPEKTGDTGFSVKYPAMFQIQFMSGENESRFFPLFHHAYLSGLDTNFRGQAGAYFKVRDDYMGLKHTISLTFSESKMLTRNDIDGLFIDPGAEKPSETTSGRGKLTPNAPTNDGAGLAQGVKDSAKGSN